MIFTSHQDKINIHTRLSLILWQKNQNFFKIRILTEFKSASLIIIKNWFKSSQILRKTQKLSQALKFLNKLKIFYRFESQIFVQEDARSIAHVLNILL